MTNGFSTAVSRLFRSFQRKHQQSDHDDDNDNNNNNFAATFQRTTNKQQQSTAHTIALLAISGAGAHVHVPKHVLLPNGFARQVRHLVDYVNLLAKSRASSRRHTAVVKALDKMTAALRNRHDQDAATRALPLHTAVGLLVMVWECVLQCFELSNAMSATTVAAVASQVNTDRASSCSSSSSTAMDDASRLELSTRALLTSLVQQKEFDFALMALGHGDCNTHRHDLTRKRSIHERGRSESRDDLRVNVRASRRGSVSIAGKARPLAPRPMPTKHDVVAASEASLCVHVKKMMDLHQTTLRALQDVHSAQMAAGFEDPNDANDRLSDKALLAQMLAVSYVRVPALRDSILTSLHQVVTTSSGRRRRLEMRQLRRQQRAVHGSSLAATPMGPVRGRSATILDEVNVALFRWMHKLHPSCQTAVTPYHRESIWAREIARIAADFQKSKFQRLFVAQLIDHVLTVAGSGGIDWKCLPGAAVLKNVVLTMTETIYQVQVRAAEASLIDTGDPNAGPAEGTSMKDADSLGRQSFSLSTADDWTIGVFLKQSMRMLGSNTPFIHDWMLTILHNTNYLLPHHVSLCMRYLSQLMEQFPSYFSGDSVDTNELRKVFTRLLQSEHFEILRTTEMFLMKHFAGLSFSLRESLIEVFAQELPRLFLHWNRDVRFCYYHMLLYLTYGGNRLVLGAKSDELLMGAVAAQLFDIPGLVRVSSNAKWDAFDTPLCELIAHVNRNSKYHTPARPTIVPRQPQQATTSLGGTTHTTMARRPKPSAMRSGMNSRPSIAWRQQQQQQLQKSGSMSKSASAPSLAGMAGGTQPQAPPPPPPEPEWIQGVPFSTIQRSIQEYRRHVEAYFSMARMISVHDPVPTPALQTAKRDAA